ncbi:MAG: hypothetical protein ACI92G_001879 [Candidatus Pelagisphaera sp.]|jgi:hypothetical protein
MEEIKPWILVSIGLTLAGYMIYLYLKDRRIDHWPKVQGKVLCSEVAEEIDWSNGRRTEMYSPYLKYEYEVVGAMYKAENIGLVESSCSIQNFAENKIRKYRRGKSVPVF